MFNKKLEEDIGGLKAGYKELQVRVINLEKQMRCEHPIMDRQITDYAFCSFIEKCTRCGMYFDVDNIKERTIAIKQEQLNFLKSQE
jgi:hypothetical protein